jgi:hypothetical protein
MCGQKKGAGALGPPVPPEKQPFFSSVRCSQQHTSYLRNKKDIHLYHGEISMNDNMDFDK